MVKQTVLIDVKIEGTENEGKINSLSASINKLQEENKKLAEANKALAKAEGDNSEAIAKNSSQIELNKQAITQSNATRKGLIETIKSEDNSIKALSVRNAELIKQRNQIDTSTEIGRKRIAAINAQLDSNNAKIKENSSALEKQRLNIGNYTSALDKISPQLSGLIQGIQGSTEASKAFIATPLGAVLAVIGGALAVVSAYFNSSEEAQGRWNKIVAFGTGLLERFMNVVEEVGGFLVDTFVNGLSAVGNVLDGFAQAIGINTQVVKDFFSEVGNEAQKFADLQRRLDVDERNLLIKRAETAKEVARLRQQAISQEGDEKRKTVQEAIELERRLAQAEVDLAKTRETLAMEELKRNGDDKEAKKAVFEATANRINQEAEFYQSTLRFQKELEKLREEDLKQLAKLNEERSRELELKSQIEQVNQRLNEYDSVQIEQTELKVKGKVNENAAQGAVNEANAKANTVNSENQKIESQRVKNTQLLSSSLGSLSGVLRENTALQKGLASSQALINTYLGATNVLTQKPPIPFPFNIIAAAATIASGLASVAKINGIGVGGAAAGGGDFVTKGPTLLLVGDNPGGVERISVSPISGRGQTRVSPNGNLIAMAGGGNLIAGSETSTAFNQAQFNASLSGMSAARPILVLQDFESVQMSRDNDVQTATVIGR